jgi:hypothetical protein
MLKDEIESAQRRVRTDAYQMSIGEVINMYRDGELIINPDFQRLFRWEIGQKSKLIESLLLGIPIPSIFVFETEESKWELIDGLQRISTLLEFMGQLKEPGTNQLKPPTALIATAYLPSLDRAVWEKSPEIADVPIANQKPLEPQQQLAIKRSRASVEILKRPSNNATKYDLFQRLNAGGTPANAQELRNCIVIMINREYSKFMHALADSPDFRAVLAATDDQIEKQRHMEYVSRFLVHTFVDYPGRVDVEQFIDDGIVALAEKGETQAAGDTFNSTFALLNQAFGGDALRRFQDGNPAGRVGLAAFEGIAVGVAKNIKRIQAKSNPVDYVRKRAIAFWNSTEVQEFFTAGLRGTIRIQRTVPFGAKWFSK